MASLLRSIVAGPRSRHPEAGLDLCYVTDNIIATSGPSSAYPQRAYRNPTDALVKFLDYKHGTNWAIWEFRAEGTGYPDSEVYGRIHHYPWPDHHPPPFALIPNIMASMREWLEGLHTTIGRVIVVHCKAGKGRSGTAACSYLISQEGWTMGDALERFTARRMRSGFGAGVSIPSQLRWIGYVERWTKHHKIYVERPIEVLELHIWGLRDGVKAAVNGFVDEGRTIKTFHVFGRDEIIVVEGNHERTTNSGANPGKVLAASNTTHQADDIFQSTPSPVPKNSQDSNDTPSGSAVIFCPTTRIVLPTSDIDIDLERRSKATYGFTMVTAVAHVWFNAFFEGGGPENHGEAAPNGVFEIEWDAMDGIKGSTRKGTKAFDRLAVIWRAIDHTKNHSFPQIVTEPEIREHVPETGPADWKGTEPNKTILEKDIGLRTESPMSRNISKASGVKSTKSSLVEDPTVVLKSHGLNGEDHMPHLADPSLEKNREGVDGVDGTTDAEPVRMISSGIRNV